MEYRVVTAGEDVCHHGIKGQRWGVRRYQNKDGSLTSVGKKRYSNEEAIKVDTKTYDQITNRYNNIKSTIEQINKSHDPKLYDQLAKLLDGDSLDKIEYDKDGYVSKLVVTGKQTANQQLTKSQTKAINRSVREHRVKVGNAVVGTLLASAWGGIAYIYLKDLGLI